MTAGNHADILAPPPLLYVGAIAIVIALHWLWPLPFPAHAAVTWIGWAFVALGIALNLWGAWSMKRARTPISPYRDTEAIVTTGAFRVSRNPLYVGLDLVFLGATLLLDSLWGIAALVVLLPLMQYGVILPEERYLEQKFGDAYAQYRARVRRYL